MTIPRYSPFEQIANRQKEIARHQENSSRLAHSFGRYKTIGWGEFQSEDIIEFDSPYWYKPSVSYGASLEDGQGDDVRASRFPRTSGLVYDWDIKGDMYCGAWVLVTVEDRSPFISPTVPDPAVSFTIYHDFTFLGIATKDINSPLNGKDTGAF